MSFSEPAFTAFARSFVASSLQVEAQVTRMPLSSTTSTSGGFLPPSGAIVLATVTFGAIARAVAAIGALPACAGSVFLPDPHPTSTTNTMIPTRMRMAISRIRQREADHGGAGEIERRDRMRELLG